MRRSAGGIRGGSIKFPKPPGHPNFKHTQYYASGWRRSTSGGKTHWTNQNAPKGSKGRHA